MGDHKIPIPDLRSASEIPNMDSDNPSVNTQITVTQNNNDKLKTGPSDEDITNSLVEEIFRFTINSKAADGKQTHLVYLDDLAAALKPTILIDLEALEQALFERLLLTDPENSVIPKGCSNFQEHVVEKKIFPYLNNSMQTLSAYENSNNQLIKTTIAKMKELIFRNAVTALKQPALFEGQNLGEQLHELLKNMDPQSTTFFINIAQEFMSDGDSEAAAALKDAINPVLGRIHADVLRSSVVSLPLYILPATQLFASNAHLAPILVDSCEPKDRKTGRAYQDSLIGALLSLSPLPTGVQYEFFDNPMDQASVKLMESSIWNAIAHISDQLHKIFLALLKRGPHIKERILSWIGQCLKANVARGKLWNVQSAVNAASIMCVSEGFMLGLGNVLLRLCQPFCNAHDDPKALKIDPTYCAVPPEECKSKSVHLDFMSSETCLLPAKEVDGQPVKRPTADTYNFVTECFFMAHKCIDLGMRVSCEKLWRLGGELGRAQRALAEVEGGGRADQLLDALRQNTRHLLIKYLSYRCALLEPQSLLMLHKLEAVTCTWLVQVAARQNPPAPQASYAPGTYVEPALPLTTEPPDTLRCVPEFVLESVVVLITISRRLVEANNDTEMSLLLSPAFTLVLTFMGDAGRTYNPHLRARLAECLEAMLPHHPEQAPLSALGTFYREQLFKEHPHRLQLLPCLLDVFVGIEMTGQSVQFEQKFNYRRPMYLVMDFLWEIEEHKEVVTRLAREAEANMEAVRPPILLRFVNLLMNDAIFLLDEALGNMAQIRNMQAARESGAWDNLPASEVDQHAANLTHIGMLARFDNILGRETTRTLVRLTAHAPYVFCHPTMVERVASMLNYFLLNLVGPNKKNFKVKDGKEYEFDPASTVLDICRMYVQLGDNERFCCAVCDDGRSYSPQLFALAEAVLVRIGGGQLIGSLQEVASRVARVAQQRAADELTLADAPEDFLDPIMSTLMMDPVILPSSKITVDRTTIARHLLSDQTDPFNRSPLSMDQVKSNTELKQRIQEWIAQRRQSSSTSMETETTSDQ